MAISSVDDRRLVESHKAGDDEAFAEIVHAYWGELVGHAVRRLREPRAAEDAVQETMLRAYRALPRFNGEYRLGAWLHRILENVCADEGNRRRREAELVEKVSALPLVDGIEPHEAAAARMPDPGFVRALATLSPSYREALLLRYVDGLPYREIANATGVTEENARARVHRARAALRKLVTVPLAVVAWLAGLRRRVQQPLEQAANRLPLPQVLAAGSAVPGKGMLAARMATLITAVALPVAGAGLSTTVDWLTGRDGGAGHAQVAAAPVEPLVDLPVDAVPATTLGSLPMKAASVGVVRNLHAKVAKVTAPSRPRQVDGDTNRWDAPQPAGDPSSARGDQRQTRQISADGLPVVVQGSQTRLAGKGRIVLPERLVDGQLDAVLDLPDDRKPDQPVRLSLTFVEHGTTAQPSKWHFDARLTRYESADGTTRIGLEGTYHLDGPTMGLARDGTFGASMVLGDLGSLRIDFPPSP